MWQFMGEHPGHALLIVLILSATVESIVHALFKAFRK